MSLEADLETTLKTPVFSGRLYALTAPAQAVLPYGVYQTISGIPEEMVDGASPNLKNSRVQISIFGRDWATVIALSSSTKAAMTAANLFKSTCANELDAPDDLLRFYGKLIDFSIWHSA